MNQEIIEKLQKLAVQESWEDGMDDNTIIYDFAGGNIDDAYYGGYCAGEISLAREILTMLEKCSVPPDGWECTRQKGHDGPCAAIKK